MRIDRFLQGRFISTLLLIIAVSPAAIAQIQPNPQNQLLAPLPVSLVSNEGFTIESASQWENIRRDELLELFRTHVYGRVPETDLEISHRVKYMDMDAIPGSVIKEVEVKVKQDGRALDFTILLFLPMHVSGPVPLFLGLNFYGNHTIHPFPGISISESWVPNKPEYGITENKATAQSRGARAYRWPVEMILSRGYGLATICRGDIDPDYHDGFKNGIHGVVQGDGREREDEEWGSIGAWAWGLSRAMDYFEKDAEIDHQRVAVIGHSRLGKTSLWAGAQDERFAMVISNNSGCGGAALSRRPFGERVSRINEVFPHWFAGKFHEYNDNESALPVDQHQLMALMAPRPVYVASAQEDDWADPMGEYLSLLYSGDVYKLYGEEVLEGEQLPEVDQPVWKGKMGYHMRTGKHDLTTYDWERYLGFADLHMLPGGEPAYDNPVSAKWIETHIRPSAPRMILIPEVESLVRRKLDEKDPVTKQGFRLLRIYAESILELDPLVHEKRGRRLLGVSREAVRRLTTLALVYRMDRDHRHLERLERELSAVCSFSDWNPSHFLDVAEMATGVALALDWTGEWLSPEIDKLARNSLVELALKPGIDSSSDHFWTRAHHNWNLVCNGGLALAAVAVFEDEPEIASRVLYQAVQSIPLALTPYAPDGIYPEGPSYWFYATTYLTTAISAFETALGTDFGFADSPGVMESAGFSQILAGPSGQYYNYFDAGLEGFHSLAHFGLLAWFSSRSDGELDWSGYEVRLNKELTDPGQTGGTRFFSTHLLHIAQLERQPDMVFKWPEIWIGGGSEPIGVFRDKENHAHSFFLAAKGGMASDNHGNMDAGSFILELEGVRWSVDPGNQDYNTLENVMGGGLWNSDQDSPRWSLLTKNNYGHSTLTVNNRKHLVNGRVLLVRKDLRSLRPRFTFHMTPLFGEDLLSARRTFIRQDDHRLVIRDELVPSATTETVTWQFITRADVTIEKERVVLRQNQKRLYLNMLSDVPHEVKVIALSPPPLPHDKEIEGLKRIEFRIGPEAFTDSLVIDVELTTEQTRIP